MAKILLEMWSVYESVGSQNLLGQVRVWIDPEANAGEGEITYNDTTPGGTDTTIGRTLYQGDGEYPSPINPFFSSAGRKLTAFQEVTAPYASITSAATACNIGNLNVTVSPATSGNNGQISISASGSNGRKEYSINAGADWSSSPVFSNLAPGVYQVVAADAARYCSVQEEVTIENQITAVDDLEIVAITVTDQQPPPADEDSGAIGVQANGINKPFTFVIIHPGGAEFTQSGISTTTFVNLFPGVYTIRVIDTKGNVRTQPNVVVLAHGIDEPTEPLDPTQITEDIDIEVRDAPCENPFPIEWENSLSGVDSWVFETMQEYSLEVERDDEYSPAYSDLSQILSNREYVNTTGRKKVKVGDNMLKKDQAEAIAKIMQSSGVYFMEQDEETGEWYRKIKLTPAPGSLRMYRSDLTFNTVELTFIYPEDYL